jgi:soluble lytic murein transglycosylase-like protein
VLVGLLVCVSLPAQCWASRHTNGATQYDEQIRAAWRRYLPQYHWGVGWAQIQQESAGNPDAVSPVGALGLAQFMPGTWEDMKRASVVPSGASPRDARHAIQAQAYYMRQLTRTWKSKRSDHDRIRLALASYNAGAGHLIKSQAKCGNPVEYAPIMECLHLVTGRHAVETRGYVPHIERHYKRRFGYDMD